MRDLAASVARVNRTYSNSARVAAAARAAHLIVDNEPRIFQDSLAEALLGDQAAELLGYHRQHGHQPILANARVQATVRARVTEDILADAVASGVDQYVLLGAGLDSFAYRSPLAPTVRVFEVDHPATQTAKRERLSAIGVDTTRVRYVPVDLEVETPTLRDRLLDAGLDPTRPAVVSWLGVTMYLTPDATGATLAQLATLAPGTQLVLDYILPAEQRDEAGKMYAELVSAHTAERGEPWLGFFTPDQMSALLATHGFRMVRDVGQREALDPAMWQRTDALRPAALARIGHAVLRAG